ncbi:uncharacterized protein LOC144648627 [Oculina patagonica]
MAFKLIFALLMFTFAVEALRVRNCGKTPVRINFINSSPLRAGRTVNFNGRFRVLWATGTRFRLFVTLRRGRRVVWRSQRNVGCRQLVKGRCPPGRGTYNAKNQRVVLPAFLPGGTYQVTGDLRDARNIRRRIACANFQVFIRARG